MPRLAFKKVYVRPVQTGEKTQTLRRFTRLSPGDLVQAMCEWGKPPFAELTVTAVERVALEDLTEEDARMDGFTSRDAMVAELAKFYPGTREFFRVCFARAAREEAGAVIGGT